VIELPQKNFLSSLFSDSALSSDAVELRTSLVFKIDPRAIHLKGSATSSLGASLPLRIEASGFEPITALTVNLHSHDLAQKSVASNGFLIITSTSPSERFHVQLADNNHIYADKTGIHAGHFVVFRLFRPGVHQIRDAVSGATCHVHVAYPTGAGRAPRSIDAAGVKLKARGFVPSAISVMPSQAIRIEIGQKAKVSTKLIEVTDLLQGEPVTRPHT
jgi:hypothetical protein